MFLRTKVDTAISVPTCEGWNSSLST